MRASPDYLPARYNLGNALLVAGRPAEAIFQFEFVLGRTPQDAAALSDLGSALAMTGRVLEAQRALERSLGEPGQREGPLQPRAHRRAGGRMAEAESHFERALAIDQSDRDIAQALAQARGAIGVEGCRGAGVWSPTPLTTLQPSYRQKLNFMANRRSRCGSAPRYAV